MSDRRRRPGGVTFIGLTQRRDTKAFGGAPVVIVNLANEFVRRGIPVEVLVFTRRGVTQFPFPFDPGVRVRYLRAQSRAALLSQIAWHLRCSRPRAVLAIGNKANSLVALATRLPGISTRLWATLHHSLSSEMAGWGAGKRRRRLRLWHRVLNRAQGLIAVSRGVAEDFAEVVAVNGDRVRVIYNPIVEPGLDERMSEPPDHPWLRDRGPPVILGVGRLTEQKDFATLLTAFALARKECPCRLLLIGEGEERERLQALVATLGVQEAVDLAGFRSNPLPHMRAATLLVMSSRWEGFGNVLVEALYCGTPVVSTDCPHGPREVLGDGDYGRLVPVGDPEAMADAILETLGQGPDRERLRARAREFSVESSADQYLEVIGFTGLQ